MISAHYVAQFATFPTPTDMYSHYKDALLDAISNDDPWEVERLAKEWQDYQDKLDAEERAQAIRVEDHQLGIYDSLPPEM